MPVQVYFVGAGPGDPELLTIKAKKVIERADVIIYADSLVNQEVCAYARNGAEIHRSSSLTLEEITEIMTSAVRDGKVVARLHTGDPSIYGAIGEQMAELDKRGVAYEIIPGVSSLFAAAATLKTELTVPDLSQTVIITRMEGRTPVPAKENLRSLAEHQSSMAIFLSASIVEEVVTELLDGGYLPDTPVAVVYRASWTDEIVLRGTLNNIAERLKASGIRKQAIILVGSFLSEKERLSRSKLYDGDFKHEYRH